jgi:hypothetical protein
MGIFSHIQSWHTWTGLGSLLGTAFWVGFKTKLGEKAANWVIKLWDRRKKITRRKVDALKLEQIKLQALTDKNLWKTVNALSRQVNILTTSHSGCRDSLIEARTERLGLVREVTILMNWKKKASAQLEICKKRPRIA